MFRLRQKGVTLDIQRTSADKSESMATDQSAIRYFPVIRDFLVVQGLNGLGGFIVGVATGGPTENPHRYETAMMWSSILFNLVAFMVAGCLESERRWRHLLWVAILVWLSNIYLVFFGASIGRWVLSIAFVSITAALGGCLSYLFQRYLVGKTE